MIFRKLKYILDLIIIFLFFYGLVFNAIPISTSKLSLIYIIIFFLKQGFLIDLFKIKILNYCLLVWVFISSYYLIISSLNPSSSLSFFVQTAWYFIEGVFGSFLLYKYIITTYGLVGSLVLVRNVFLAQSVFIIITFVNLEFRESVNQLLVVNDKRYLNPFRMKGFANSGGAGLSYLQMVGVLISCILYIIDKRKSSYKHILIAILIVISQIFVARTGMLFSILIIIATFLQQSINNGSIFNFIRVILISLLSVNVLYIGVLKIMPTEQVYVFEETVLNRAFEFIDSYEETGSFSTQSTDLLMSEMYFLPSTTVGLLFGEALWDDPPGTRDYFHRKVDSDVGYVRLIFAVGLMMTVLFYSIYYLYIKNILCKSDLSHIKIIIIVLAFVFIFGESKEPFLVRSSGIVKSLFLLYYIIILNPISNIFLKTNNER